MNVASWPLLVVFTMVAALAQSGTLRPEVMPPEDPQLRTEAVRLLEKANLVSTPVWPANQEDFSFRVLDPSLGETTSGALKIGVASTGIKRWEFSFGSYKYVRVQNGREFATARTDGSEPAALTSARKLLPVFLGRFDSADVIRRFEDTVVDGRPARCISFQTIKGDHQQPGRACVDAAQGWLLEVSQGDETIRQSKFYRFNNGYLPGHIERWAGDRKILEIDSKVVVREQFPEDYFAYPEGASIEHMCTEFHRAFADNTPQPQQKGRSNDLVEVRVHGFVGRDGRPYGLKALDTVRPDLAEEAVSLVSSWTYHPATCDYDPATMETEFTVRFKGW